MKAAIVGCGLMGRWHAAAVRHAAGRVVACVDADAERAAALAARHPGARALHVLEEALDCADVIHICTPSETHDALASAALTAARHVLVEKPLAADAKTTAALLDLAAANQVLLCPVHQLVFQDGVRELIASRERLGRVRHIDFHVCSAGADDAGIAMRARIAREILPHPLSLLHRLAPATWCESDWALRAPDAGEIRALVEANGVTAAICISMSGRPTRHRLGVIGSASSAMVDLFHGFAVAADGAVSRRRKIVQPFSDAANIGVAASANLVRRAVRREPAYPGLRALVAAFYDAARARREAPVTRDEILGVARTFDRLEGLLRDQESAAPAGG